MDVRALVEAARAGDREAMGLLVARYRSAVLERCIRLLRDPDLAEDAVQEAAVVAWLHIGRLRDPGAFGSWFVGIARNVCRQWRAARRKEAWRWEVLEGGRVAPAACGDPEALVEAAELRAWVRRAVAALPPGQRAAVVLFYFSGLAHQEVARRLRTRPTGVKSRLHKARVGLRRRWLREVDGMDRFVEVRVRDVRRTVGEPSHHVVVLEEVGGTRQLPIWIGPAEATAIALALTQTALPRPGPYQFAAGLLRAAGGRVREVRITRLVGDTYYAEVTVEGWRGREVVDSRPSDAIALALVEGVPIRVEAALFEGSARTEWATYPEGAREIAARIRSEIRRPGTPPCPA